MKVVDVRGSKGASSEPEASSVGFRRLRVSRIARLTISFIAVSLLSLALGVAATSLVKSPEQLAAETAPPPRSLLTVGVTSGTIKESILVTGEVTAGRVVTFTPPAPAGMDAVVTALPALVGEEVGPGSLLLAVSDRPLILLYGDVPLTRDLARGSAGPDVTRLQIALRGAGLAVSDKAGVFGYSTQRALAGLYQSVNYAPPVDENRRPVALRSELAIAPAGEFGRVSSLGVILGGPVTSPAIGITTASSIVTAEVSVLDAQKLGIGFPVMLSGAELPTPVLGNILSVGELAKNDNGGMSIRITVAPDVPLPTGLVEGDSLQISADFSIDEEPGLLVPLAGIYSDADGTTSVIVVKDGVKSRESVEILATGDGMAKFAAVGNAVHVGDQIYVGVR